MKIAQSCFRFGAPGGAEDHVLHISKEMVKRGHEVTVHTSDMFTETPWKRGSWPKDETVDGVKVVRHKAYVRPVSARWSMLVMPDMIGASVISLMARVNALEQLIVRHETNGHTPTPEMWDGHEFSI